MNTCTIPFLDLPLCCVGATAKWFVGGVAFFSGFAHALKQHFLASGAASFFIRRDCWTRRANRTLALSNSKNRVICVEDMSFHLPFSSVYHVTLFYFHLNTLPIPYTTAIQKNCIFAYFNN